MSGLKKLSKRLPSLGGALDRSSELPQLAKPISETSSVIVNPPSSGTSLERYPIPIKITTVRGLDANWNRLYNVVELDGDGNPLEETHENVPNLGRPAATLSVNDQTDMGYSSESDSFFFSEAT